jgi:hypothetical protein
MRFPAHKSHTNRSDALYVEPLHLAGYLRCYAGTVNCFVPATPINPSEDFVEI